MVQKLDLVIDGSTKEGLLKGAAEIAKRVRAGWDQDKLQFKLYTDGITNQLVGVWYDDRESQILVRVYGNKTEMFIDRDTERRNIEVLHKAGCGPELLAVFSNGVSYGFTKGMPTSEEDVLQEPIWKDITRELAKLHRIEEGDGKPMLFPKLRQFLNLLPDTMSDTTHQQRLVDKGYTKSKLEEEANMLEDHLNSLGCPIVFSHNDLLLGNVIWDKEAKKASFIDYEYGASNYQPYDIANHFNEFVGVENIDYNRYPDEEFQREWIRSYISHYQSIPPESVEESQVSQWYVWVNKFALASHIFWGVWAILQACHSSIDFDFFGYALIRLDEYTKRKEEFLGLAVKE
ncbi:ethanolamine kinase 1-like [Penaeus japonicus]|uniref:ethanolamine kinase 1-like n=1 Tax=Penaeus japonicus TaxID=27405 RepID=UPI001C70EF8E|nr:ethanolamine kinase 1-like [Penaeus japonicus]